MRRTIIEIKQDVAIGKGIILEKGDFIEVIREDETFVGTYGKDKEYQYPEEGEKLTDTGTYEYGRDNHANIHGDPFVGKSLEGDKKESVKRRKEMQGDGDATELVNREVGVERPSEGDPSNPREDSIEVSVDATLVNGNYANPGNDGKSLAKGGGNDDAGAKNVADTHLVKTGSFAGETKELTGDADAAAKANSRAKFLQNNTELKTDIVDSTGRDNNRLAQPVKESQRFYNRRLVLK